MGNDSIQHITDSIIEKLPDTLTATIPHIQRMSGIALPFTARTEHWLGVFFLGMFALLFLCWISDNNILLNKLSVVQKFKERESIFKHTTLTKMNALIFFHIFFAASISMHLYMFTHSEKTPFSIGEYSIVLLYTTIFFATKHLCCMITEYTFVGKRKTKEKTWIDEYFNALGLFSIVLFLSTILYVYGIIPNTTSYISVSYTMYVIMVGLLAWRANLFFLHKKTFFVYILLYLCAFEILPFLLLIQVIRNGVV